MFIDSCDVTVSEKDDVVDAIVPFDSLLSNDEIVLVDYYAKEKYFRDAEELKNSNKDAFEKEKEAQLAWQKANFLANITDEKMMVNGFSMQDYIDKYGSKASINMLRDMRSEKFNPVLNDGEKAGSSVGHCEARDTLYCEDMQKERDEIAAKLKDTQVIVKKESIFIKIWNKIKSFNIESLLKSINKKRNAKSLEDTFGYCEETTDFVKYLFSEEYMLEQTKKLIEIGAEKEDHLSMDMMQQVFGPKIKKNITFSETVGLSDFELSSLDSDFNPAYELDTNKLTEMLKDVHHNGARAIYKYVPGHEELDSYTKSPDNKPMHRALIFKCGCGSMFVGDNAEEMYNKHVEDRHKEYDAYADAIFPYFGTGPEHKYNSDFFTVEEKH